MAKSMKAVRLHEIGGPVQLRVEEIPEPTVAAGRTLVRVRAAALNHRDVFITEGRYPNIVLPRTLGSDGAGELDGRQVLIDPQLGWGTDDEVWEHGASILGMPEDGTLAEYVAVPPENVYEKPEHLSLEEAAALPLAGLTAYRAVFTRARVQPGETVLVTGIGGGVQTFVMLFAHAIGARVLVTSGSDDKLERASDFGAEIGVNYRTDTDWHKTLRKRGGRIDAVIDSAGGETFARALTVVRPGGRVVTYGGTTGDATIKMFPVFWNHLTIMGTSMGSPRDFAAMLQFVERHAIRPVVDRVYEMSETVRAAERMREAGQFGKIVIRIP